MMKEDSHLICPISYDDPAKLWTSFIHKELMERLPLEDVTWKSPISAAFVTIPVLPLRFLSSTANLFVDTDHKFRWFLAPYVHVYVVSAETLDSYRHCKPVIRQWVDAHSGVKRASWLILYVPLGTQSMDTYSRIYTKISNDFNMGRSGDRSVLLFVSALIGEKTVAGSSMTSFQRQQCLHSMGEVVSKLREGIIASFQQRSAQYDGEIRRLDSLRGTPQLNFRQLFLVKESLALMYQMMQLPAESLVQYEELEALLQFVPPGGLPSSDWPMVISEDAKSSKSVRTSSSKTLRSLNSGSGGGTGGGSGVPTPTSMDASVHASSESGVSGGGIGNEDSKPATRGREKERDKGPWADPCRQGDSVLVYSINEVRERVLKQKISLSELNRYVFARQMYFLSVLGRQLACAEKGYKFVVATRNAIERQLLSSAYAAPPTLTAFLSPEKRVETADDTSTVPPAETAEAAVILGRSQSSSGPGGSCVAVAENIAPMAPMSILELRCRQADAWAVSAAIRIAKSCRENVSQTPGRASAAKRGEHGANSAEGRVESATVGLGLGCGLSGQATGFTVSHAGGTELEAFGTVPSSSQTASSSAATLELNEALMRDWARYLVDLMQFAFSRLVRLSCTLGPMKAIMQPSPAGAAAAGVVVDVTAAATTTTTAAAAAASAGATVGVSRSASDPQERSEELQQPAAVNSMKAYRSCSLLMATAPVRWSESKEQLVARFPAAYRQLVASVTGQEKVDISDLATADLTEAVGSFWQRVRSLLGAAYPHAMEVHDAETGALSTNSAAGFLDQSLDAMSAEPDESIQSIQSLQSMQSMSPLLSPSRLVVFPFTQQAQQRIADKARFYEISAIYFLSKAVHDQCLAANRPRMATQFDLHCADVLFVGGAFDKAKVLYLEILETISPADKDAYHGQSVLSKAEQARAAAGVSMAAAVTGRSSRVSALTRGAPDEWVDLRFWVLRKLLICSRMDGDEPIFVLVALQLLEPHMQLCYQRSMRAIGPLARGVLGETVTAGIAPDCADLLKELVDKLTFDKAETTGENEDKDGGVVSMTLFPYFEFSLSFDAAVPVSSCSKMIHDEIFPVSCASITGGGRHYVNLNILSHLPGPVPAEKVRVVYRSFSASSFLGGAVGGGGGGGGSRSSSFQDAVGGDREGRAVVEEFVCDAELMDPPESDRLDGSGGLDGDKGCQRCAEGNGQLTLRPGLQTVRMRFSPPHTGEYVVAEVSIQVGCVMFCTASSDSVSVEEGKTYLKSHVLLNVMNPAHAIAASLEAPAYTPSGHRGELRLSITMKDGDILDRLAVSVMSENTILSALSSSSLSQRIDLSASYRPSRRGSADFDDLTQALDSQSAAVEPLLTRFGDPTRDGSNVAINMEPCTQWRIFRGSALHSARDDGADESHRVSSAGQDSAAGEQECRVVNGADGKSLHVFNAVASSSSSSSSGGGITIFIPFAVEKDIDVESEECESPNGSATDSSLSARPRVMGGSDVDGIERFAKSDNALPTVVVYLSGQVIRDQCCVDIDMNVACSVTVGDGLLTSSECYSTGTDPEQFLCQICLRNDSTLPIKLLGFAARCYPMHTLSFEFVPPQLAWTSVESIIGSCSGAVMDGNRDGSGSRRRGGDGDGGGDGSVGETSGPSEEYLSPAFRKLMGYKSILHSIAPAAPLPTPENEIATAPAVDDTAELSSPLELELLPGEEYFAAFQVVSSSRTTIAAVGDGLQECDTMKRLPLQLAFFYRSAAPYYAADWSNGFSPTGDTSDTRANTSAAYCSDDSRWSSKGTASIHSFCVSTLLHLPRSERIIVALRATASIDSSPLWLKARNGGTVDDIAYYPTGTPVMLTFKLTIEASRPETLRLLVCPCGTQGWLPTGRGRRAIDITLVDKGLSETVAGVGAISKATGEVLLSVCFIPVSFGCLTPPSLQIELHSSARSSEAREAKCNNNIETTELQPTWLNGDALVHVFPPPGTNSVATFAV